MHGGLNVGWPRRMVERETRPLRRAAVLIYIVTVVSFLAQSFKHTRQRSLQMQFSSVFD